MKPSRANQGLGDRLRWLLPFVLILLVFLVDLRVPRGMGYGVVYALVLLPSLWSRGGAAVILVAAASTVAAVVGYIGSPVGAVPPLALTNRAVAIVAIWTIAAVLSLRKRAESRLAESERALSTLLTNLPGMAYSALNEPDWPMLFVSEGAQSLTGYPAEAITTGQPAYGDIIHPDDRDRIWEEVQVALARDEPFDLIYRIRRPDGAVRTVAERGCAVQSADGQLRIEGFVEDITERQETQATAEFQSLLLENVREAVIATDMEAQVTFWSHGAEAMFGRPASEVVRRPIEQVMAAPDRRELRMKALATGSARAEYEIRRHDGVTLTAETVLSAVHAPDGTPIGYISILRDVTDRKQAEEALKLSRARLQAYIDASPAAIVGIDLEQRVELWNRAAEQLFGWTSDEILGQTYPLATGDLRRGFQANVRELHQRSIEQREVVRLNKAGERLQLELSAGAVTTENGEVAGMVAVLTDVRERRLLERERLRLTTAIEQTAESVLVTDADGRIRYVNPAFERITGYRREDVLGRHPRMLGPGRNRDEQFEELWEQLERGEVWRGRLANERQDGTPYLEETVITPIWTGEQIVGYVATARDVTVEVELEQQLRQAQKMEAVGQLAGGVAHDFNNLLQAIRGHLSFALDASPPTSTLRDDLEQAELAADRAAVLTRQLLAFSRRQILDLQERSLNALIDQLLKMVRRVLPEDIETVFHPAEQLPTVRVDAGQIEQVVLNLCLNARDAMPNGGRITIATDSLFADARFRADRAWAEPGRYCLLTVSDTGQGMSEEVLNRVFEPFFTTKELGEGTGLGLAVAYGIVQQHKGMIEVDSEPGKGSTFRLYLPAVLQAADDLPAPAEAPIAGGSETILVAEDDPSILRLTVRTLERAGYRVITATDGEQAWELFQRHRHEIDLAVLDVVMPKLSGNLLWERMQASGAELPVLFASGYQKETLVGRFGLRDGLHLLQKPYPLRDLLRYVRELLDRSPPRDDSPR